MSLQISIIGAGTMGSGIAQLVATHCHKVVLVDINSDVLDQSKDKLKKTLNRLLEKNKLSSNDIKNITNNIHWTSDMNDVANSTLIIEAVVEDLEVKRMLFSDIENLVSKDCVLATNTSSLSVSEIASACRKPDRAMGLHFFNPVSLMKLVELIPAAQTRSAVKDKVIKIVEGWDKIVVVAKDTPGFIVNRLARPYYGEALRIYEEGTADFATIDWAMKKFGNFRMGPFELMDLIGIDVNYMATKSVFVGFDYNPRFKPSQIQKKMVDEGRLGRKSGEGFYKYGTGELNPEPIKDEKLGQNIFHRILAMLINEAIEALYTKIGSKEDIDLAMCTGVNYPNGLLKWADDWGLDNVLNQLVNLQETYRDDRYRPSVLLRNKIKDNSIFYA